MESRWIEIPGQKKKKVGKISRPSRKRLFNNSAKRMLMRTISSLPLLKTPWKTGALRRVPLWWHHRLTRLGSSLGSNILSDRTSIWSSLVFLFVARWGLTLTRWWCKKKKNTSPLRRCPSGVRHSLDSSMSCPKFWFDDICRHLVGRFFPYCAQTCYRSVGCGNVCGESIFPFLSGRPGVLSLSIFRYGPR